MDTTTTKMADVMIHVDENIARPDREALRSRLLARDGVMAADYHDDKPHLMIVVYDPDAVSAAQLLEIPKARGLHAQLVGL